MNSQVTATDPNMRLLIIEDDRESADYLVKAFREVGYVADLASDGEEGLALADTGDYDVLVIDRTLQPVPGSIVVFFHEGSFYTREYQPRKDGLLLKADEGDDIIIANGENWVCWGVVILTLNPVLQPQHRKGRYARVCAC